jgi:hypothetical protein
MNLVKRSLPLLLLCLSVAISMFLVSFTSADKVINKDLQLTTVEQQIVDSAKIFPIANDELVTRLYDSAGLQKAGLSKQAFTYALNGYLKMRSNHSLQNSQYLTIVDFSQSSRQKRFYLIDVPACKLVVNTFVAHGRNTGVDMATKFSNSPESNESSLGFYVTKGTYIGKHGLSLRIDGLENGFNDKAEARGIVVHAADYVNAGRVNSAYMGRSQGCPALPNEIAPQVINMIKDGTAMFLYYPSETYLKGSRILNS